MASGRVVRPYPRWSGATTWYPAAASAGSWCRHEYQSSGKPWHRITGARSGVGSPASARCMSMPLTATVRCRTPSIAGKPSLSLMPPTLRRRPRRALPQRPSEEVGVRPGDVGGAGGPPDRPEGVDGHGQRHRRLGEQLADERVDGVVELRHGDEAVDETPPLGLGAADPPAGHHELARAR